MRPKHQKVAMTFCVAAILALQFATLSIANANSPAFGLVSVGDSSQATFGGIFISNFTSPTDLGTITQISVYLATGGTSAKAVIYSNHDGVPDALLTQSNDVTIDGTSGRWVNFDVSYTGKPDTTYWLGILFSSAGTYYYVSSVNGKSLYSSSITEAPNTFSGGTANPNEELSVYAVYSAATSSSSPNDQGIGLVETVLLVVAIFGIVLAAIVIGLVVRSKKQLGES